MLPDEDLSRVNEGETSASCTLQCHFSLRHHPQLNPPGLSTLIRELDIDYVAAPISGHVFKKRKVAVSQEMVHMKEKRRARNVVQFQISNHLPALFRFY